MARKITVLKIDQIDDLNHPRREERRAALEATQAALRVLRPLGLKFSTETIDGGETTVVAWIEEREAKVKRERQALGSAIPASDGEK